MCTLKFFYHVLFLLSNVLLSSCVDWKASFDPNAITVKTTTKQRVRLILSGLPDETIANLNVSDYVQLKSGDTGLATVSQTELKFVELERSNRSWYGFFDIEGIFLGQTAIYVEIKNSANVVEKSNEKLIVTVLRQRSVLDLLFSYSVLILVSILYVSFGAAISLPQMKDILRKPVGPGICFVAQFLFMPLCSYVLGLLLFPNAHEMALGLFFTGIVPGGGASNMWTLLLGGNVNLSVAMTTISTIAAFAMMPLWIFTLGRTIFDRANLGVPYQRILLTAAGLLIPLAIGLLIQRFMPKTAKLLVKILKPVSLVLVLLIVTFAVIANWYIFKLFSWQIVVAGLGLPWLGYVFGWIASKVVRQSTTDAIAIAIETGLQNTGIAVFLLKFSLEQPTADLTTVIPISVGTMTPVPLLAAYLILKIKQFCNRKKTTMVKDNATPESDSDSSKAEYK